MRGVQDPVVSDLAPGGVLRAAINLGYPVLAQGPAATPAGLTVDIARELGARLGVGVDLVCFTAARESLAAMVRGDTDVCFLARWAVMHVLLGGLPFPGVNGSGASHRVRASQPALDSGCRHTSPGMVDAVTCHTGPVSTAACGPLDR